MPATFPGPVCGARMTHQLKRSKLTTILYPDGPSCGDKQEERSELQG
jgi:hypothetical protein